MALCLSALLAIAASATAGATRTSFTSAETTELGKITEVLFVSFESPPFAFTDGTGFALDMATEVASRLFGSPTISIDFMNTSFSSIVSAMSEDRCDPATNPHRLCIGASALSTTSERAQTTDYLTTFYLSGLKVITRVAPNYGETAGQLALKIIELFGTTLGFVVFVLLVVAPIAWVSEMLEPESIFRPHLDDDDGSKDKDAERGANERRLQRHSSSRQLSKRPDVQGLSEEEKARVIMKKTIINALMWVIGTFTGSILATPRSKGAKGVRVLLNGLLQFVIILTTASAAALLGSGATSSASAETIAEMGSLGLTICVEDWSEGFVRSNNKNGARIHLSKSYNAMLDDLWDGVCDAAVYDAPLLEYSLAKAQSKGIGQSFGLVGELLNFDPYGFVLPLNHPLVKPANRVMIDVVRDETFQSSLESKYFGYTFSASSGGTDGGTITAFILIPLAIVIITALGSRSYFQRQKDKIAQKIQAAVHQGDVLDVVALRDEAFHVAPADIAMIPSTNLVHDIALELNSVKRIVCELLLAIGTTGKSPGLARARLSQSLGGPCDEASLLTQTPRAAIGEAEDEGFKDIMLHIPAQMVAGMTMKVALGKTGKFIQMKLPDGIVPNADMKARVWTNSDGTMRAACSQGQLEWLVGFDAQHPRPGSTSEAWS